MTKTLKIALAFLATGAAATAFAADDETGRRAGRDGMTRLERLDADSSGDITFEEFSDALQGRLGTADADKDGKLTVGEIATAIEKRRADRAAARLVRRFDTNGDGMLTRAEIDDRQKKRFAWLDRDGDGKITPTELPRRQDRGAKRRLQ